MAILLCGVTFGQTNTFPDHGNVGIGTIAPNHTLDIYGTSRSINLGDSVGSLLFRNNSGGTNEIRSYGLALEIETRDFQDIFFNSNNGNSKLVTIKGDGSGVGIGTITPNHTLDIYGASRSINLGDSGGSLLFRNNSGGTNEIRSYGLALEIETRDFQDIFFNSNNGNSKLVTIKGDGSGVGIGTIAPNHTLDIYGASRSINLGDSVGSLLFRNNSGGTNEIRSYGLALEIETRDFQDIFFNSNNGNSKLVTIKGDGSGVGIGTTTPDSKLTVKGKIHAEEVKIDLSVPAPDYVFKKEYDLLTIDEVQQHIQEKGHLPNIPSAKVMETEGVDLGTMNMKLLEKIEELTLYAIEQNKKNKEQEERIKILEKKLETLLNNQ
ncbi:hypothetical protein GCM10022258_24970 [Aquimarina gracilis]